MFSWLTKSFIRHFIPHMGNEHRPHLLRNIGTRNIVVLVIFLELFTFLLPTLSHINFTGGMAAILPGVLSALTNNERQSQNLNILSVNPILNKVAEMKALDMATKSYFAHTSPEGKTPWYWLEIVGYRYQYAGENLAVNFIDSKDVTQAWMESPTHKANIVKGKYTEIGTGIAKGMYEGRETVFVAQVYANPLPKTEAQIKPIRTTVRNVKPKAEAVIAPEQSKVLGEETGVNNRNVLAKETTEPTLWQKLLAAPRSTMNFILLFFSVIIAVSLFLYLFIKIKHFHLDLITNGLIVLAILGGIFLANYYTSYHGMSISQSLDYSNEN